jgi:hypothetical protein
LYFIQSTVKRSFFYLGEASDQLWRATSTSSLQLREIVVGAFIGICINECRRRRLYT